MKLWLAVTLALTAACGGEAQAPEAGAAAPVATTTVVVGGKGTPEASGERPAAIYRTYLDQAQKEITPENARERLRELERQIDLERQALD